MATRQKPSSSPDVYIADSVEHVEVRTLASKGNTRLILRWEGFGSKLKESSREKFDREWKIFSKRILELT